MKDQEVHKEVKEEKKAPVEDKSAEPHLGAPRNSSGIRCKKPPGGGSSIVIG